MTIADFIKLSKEQLRLLYSEREIKAMAQILLEHYGCFSSTQIHAFPDADIKKDILHKLIPTLQELATGKPLQYAIGEAQFCNLHFEVNEHVLIPRPETEELVYWASEALDVQTSLKVLDLCTGSGCIAISLAKQFPKVDISACDISSEAIAVARRNAEKNEVSVHFFEGDILDLKSSYDLQYSLIVSNPPYVRQSERASMHKNVLGFEPAQALFVPGEDPLIFYRAIAIFAQQSLFPNGCVLVELNEAFGNETAKLFRDFEFSEVTLRKDINGKDRMLKAKK